MSEGVRSFFNWHEFEGIRMIKQCSDERPCINCFSDQGECLGPYKKENEMSNTEQQIEKEIQDKGLNAPRLTPDHIDSVIVDKYFFTAANAQWGADPNTTALIGLHKQLETLTFCVLILKNGFTVTGESACASPENFDAEIGKKIAYQNAREKIWMLEGYLLKDKLHNA